MKSSASDHSSGNQGEEAFHLIKPRTGPEHVLHYLARYTHRVAISNHRLLNVTDTEVTFRWKDYAHYSKSRVMTLTHEEFLRRFLQLSRRVFRLSLAGSTST
jgi:hypothetical protein